MESQYLKHRRQIKLGNLARARKKFPKELPKKSSKFKTNDKAYKKIVKEILAENNECELNITGICIRKATGLHHKKRRGVNLLNKKYLLRACNPCNYYVEKHPQYAVDHGLSVSVHKKETPVN